MDLVVVGSANYDYLAKGGQLPGPGQSTQGDQFVESPGGKGANQAVAAARLGASVAFTGCIGQDQRGDWVLDRLRMEGVDTQNLIRDSSAPTGVALIQVDQSGQKQIQAVMGANGHLSTHHLPEQIITAARGLVVQLEIPLPVVESAIRIAHQAGVKVILDPAPPATLPGVVFRQVDIIKPNSKEAGALTGIQVHDRATARKAADLLLGRGVQAVMIQAGKKVICWSGKEVKAGTRSCL